MFPCNMWMYLVPFLDIPLILEQQKEFIYDRCTIAIINLLE